MVVETLGRPNCKYRIQLVKKDKHNGWCKYKTNSGKFVICINLWPYDRVKHPGKFNPNHVGHDGFSLSAHYWATLIHEIAHSRLSPKALHGRAWRRMVRTLTNKFLRTFVRLDRDHA